MDTSEKRELAKMLFGRVWTLLETEERTREQEDEMIHAAHASRFHWGDWDLAFAYEALARAYTAAGNRDEAGRYKELARQAGEQIADGEDREVFDADFATL